MYMYNVVVLLVSYPSPSSSGSVWPFSLCSASSVYPSTDHVTLGSNSGIVGGGVTRSRGLGSVDNTSLCQSEAFTAKKVLRILYPEPCVYKHTNFSVAWMSSVQ